MSEEVREVRVEILESPWSGGRTIESYYGPVSTLVHVSNERVDWSDRIAAGMHQAIDEICRIAAVRGANAVASPALEIDPFGEKTEIRAGGSAFELRTTGSRWPEPKSTWPCSPWMGGTL